MSLLSPSGRMPPQPFSIAVAAIYVASFASQVLLSVSVTAQTGLWSFALVQMVLIWLWLVLHTKRLHDAGQNAGVAGGIAAIYLLAIVLLLMIMGVMHADVSSSGDAPRVWQLFAVIYFFADLAGGVAGYWLLAVTVLMLAPVALALGFSLWAATRPSVPAAP